MSGEMSPQCRDMKGLFSSVTLSEHLQRRTGEHETSGAPIQSLWNPSSSLVVPMAVRQGATKTLLLCFLAGNGTCCFSFQMSFTHLHRGADPNPQPQKAQGVWLRPGFVGCDWQSSAFTACAWQSFVTMGCEWGLGDSSRCAYAQFITIVLVTGGEWTHVQLKTKFTHLISEPRQTIHWHGDGWYCQKWQKFNL